VRFLADMGVDVRVVRWLRESGHDATHLRDEGLQRLSNGEIVTKAVSENRVVVTFDLDFGEVVALSRAIKTSIITFRLYNTRTSHVIDRLSAVLTESGSELEQGVFLSRLRNHAIESGSFPSEGQDAHNV
jgi:predicted nuclease of predicted toxin-antitoxin system